MTEPELWEHFESIMRRHLRDEDAKLSDADFVKAVFERFLKERRKPIIDVNE